MVDLQELQKDLKLSILELESIGRPTAHYRFWTTSDTLRAIRKVAERLANCAASIEQETSHHPGPSGPGVSVLIDAPQIAKGRKGCSK